MSRLKYDCCLAAASLAVLCLAGNVQADDSAVEQLIDQPQKFGTTIHNCEIIGREQVRRVFVSHATNEFIFTAPYGLRVEAKPAMLAVVSPDSTFFLTFRILSSTLPELNLGNLDSYRDLVFDRFPEAKVTEESSKTIVGRTGPTFDLRVKFAGGVERNVRVVLIPSAAGLLEFTLNADTSKLADARNAFNIVLRTFRSNEHGKLEIVPRVSDQS